MDDYDAWLEEQEAEGEDECTNERGYDPCLNCSGEDCVCCEVYLEDELRNLQIRL